MISASYEDQKNHTSKSTVISETLNKLVASFNYKNPGNATVGAAAAE